MELAPHERALLLIEGCCGGADRGEGVAHVINTPWESEPSVASLRVTRCTRPLRVWARDWEGDPWVECSQEGRATLLTNRHTFGAGRDLVSECKQPALGQGCLNRWSKRLGQTGEVPDIDGGG